MVLTIEQEKQHVAKDENDSNHPEIHFSGTPELVAEASAGVEPERYLTGLKLALTFFGLMLSLLLTSLDLTIVGTALPRIVSDFNKLEDVTWVPTACTDSVIEYVVDAGTDFSSDILTQCSAILPIGQTLTIYPTKYVYLFSIIVFELGSLICGVSKSIASLIVGRAIAGIGSAGIGTSVICIIVQVAKLEHRPALFGLFGTVYALASVLGPLVGGELTDRVSWRWCFFINLPVGGVSLGFAVFLRYQPVFDRESNGTLRTMVHKFLSIDWFGATLFLGAAIALLLPIQLGGNVRPWRSADTLAPICASIVLFFCFAYWQKHMGTRALLPLTVIRKTLLGSACVAFFTFYGLIVGIYYLPLWYQAQGRTAAQSGIDILPFLLSVVIASMIVGGFVQLTGHYWTIMVVSPLLYSVGSGLLYTLHIGSPHSKLIGYQILSGIGIGGVLQLPEISTQAEYANEEEMIPQATGFCSFIEQLGGIIGLAAAGSVLFNQLSINIKLFAPELSSTAVSGIHQSILFIFTLPESQQTQVMRAYAKSLDQVFLAGIPAGVLSSLASLLLVRKYNLKTRVMVESQEGEA